MGLKSYLAGIKGEELAEQYLSQRGYQIIERNFHSQQGEIDLVAKDQDVLAFVEVKNYSFRSFGSPLGAVRKSKRQSIIHAARTYLYKKAVANTFCRFDVLIIYRDRCNRLAVELYKDAFKC